MLVKQRAGMFPALYLPIETATNKEEGKKKKSVLFTKDPREVYIPKYCVQVPWELYITKGKTGSGKERKLRRPPIYHLLDDVITDRRLKDIHWRIVGLAEGMKSVSITKSEAVQKYAKELTGKDTVWVMQFVNMDREDKNTKERISFARMCLVPEGTTNPKDRIKDALAHLNAVVTDENMGEERRRRPRGDALELEDALPAREWKTSPYMIHWRQSWNVILQTALDLIRLVEQRRRKVSA